MVVAMSRKGLVLRGHGIDDNGHLRDDFHLAHQRVPAILAVEVPCYVSGGRSIIDTILWTGRFIEAWEHAGGRVRRIERHQVYKHICPGTKGCDAAVRRGLIARFGPPGTKKKPGRTYGIKLHMWAALGVAVTAAETKGGGGWALSGSRRSVASLSES